MKLIARVEQSEQRLADLDRRLTEIQADLEERLALMVRRLAEFQLRMEQTHPQVRHCPNCGRSVAAKAKTCGICRTELSFR